MEFKPGHTVGIDLGTTFSTLAHLDQEGNPVPIANEDDDVETPSLILLAESGHVVVGPSRTRAAMEDPEHVVERVKRYMGNAEYKRTFDGREITPEFLSGLILKKLRQDAEKRIGKIGNAVITVPYYFNDARRKATRRRRPHRGLERGRHHQRAHRRHADLRLAASGELGAGGNDDKPRLALVYDLGGGTFDVTVVRYTPTHFQVLATDGDVHLGGIDWNDRLVDYVADEFKSRHGLDPRSSPATLQMLRHDCDQAKIALTETNADHDHLPPRRQERLRCTITREQFEEMTADLLQRTSDTARAGAGAGRSHGRATRRRGAGRRIDADAAGAADAQAVDWARSRITGFRRTRPWPKGRPSTRRSSKPSTAANRASWPNESASCLRNVKQEDVNSHGLGVAARNPKTGKTVNHVMIPRNSSCRPKSRRTFVTSEPNQQRVNVKVIEGDAPDPAACSLLGNCRITGLPPNLPKGSPIEVVYAFDASGRVRVRAHDKTGGKEAEIEIERKGGLNASQLNTFTSLAEQLPGRLTPVAERC